MPFTTRTFLNSSIASHYLAPCAPRISSDLAAWEIESEAREDLSNARGRRDPERVVFIRGIFLKPKNSARFFKRPEVISRVREIQQQRIDRDIESSEIAAKQLGISKRWVLERLKYNADRCLRGMPVFDEAGVQIPGKFTGKPDAAGANRALHLIGLELGMFIEHHEIGGPGDFSRLTDDELARQMAEDATAIGIPAEVIEQLLLAFQTVDE